MSRTFAEVALCHLPEEEIDIVYSFLETGLTSFYANEAGFFIWTGTLYVPPVLHALLSTHREQGYDYVLFDIDVEPNPNWTQYEHL